MTSFDGFEGGRPTIMTDLSAALNVENGVVDVLQNLTDAEDLSELEGALDVEHGVRAVVAAVFGTGAAESSLATETRKAPERRGARGRPRRRKYSADGADPGAGLIGSAPGVGAREGFGRWAASPLPPNPSRRDLREWHLEETALKHQVRWIWNDFCSGVELTRRIVPTGFGTREPPLLGHITLGPPTRFTIELRAGQLVTDLLAVSDRLAAAYLVDDVEVRPLASGWITIELIEYGIDNPHGRTPPANQRQSDPMPRRDEVRHWPRRQHRSSAGGDPSIDFGKE